MSTQKSNKYFLLLMLGLALISLLALFGGVAATLVSSIITNLEGGEPIGFPIPFEHYRIAGAVNILGGLIGAGGAVGVFKRAKWGLGLAIISTVILWLNGVALGGHMLVYTPPGDLPAFMQAQMTFMAVGLIIIITALCGGLVWLSRKEEVLSEFGG